ncbi:hypothetical protein P9112_001623 [Eukaryota sp. TZLM1-RC]
MTTGQRLCVALGGNALQSSKSKGTWAETTEAARGAMEQLSKLVVEGHNLVLTHGNGPQVGSLLIQNEKASDAVPPLPLPTCGAQTQGYIGYLLQQELGNALRAQNIEPTVATVVTQTVVSLDDPAWENPTKPIGPFYTEEKAKALEAEGKVVKEDSGRGYRQVVASPQPMVLSEKKAILNLVNAGFTVICSGGGGVPCIEREGRLVGVDAVIDKDLSSAILAKETNADVLMILTDVETCMKDFRSDNPIALRHLTIESAEELIKGGEFGAGSMGPKVQAAVNFVKTTGRKAIITSLHKVAEALRDETGTHITA